MTTPDSSKARRQRLWIRRVVPSIWTYWLEEEYPELSLHIGLCLLRRGKCNLLAPIQEATYAGVIR